MNTAIRILAVVAVWATSSSAGPGKPKKPFTAGGPSGALPANVKSKFEECDGIIKSMTTHVDGILRKESPERSVMVVDWQNKYTLYKDLWESTYSAAMEALSTEFGKDKQWTADERAVRRYYTGERDRTAKALDHVFRTVGDKLAMWKWQYNVKMSGMQTVIDGMPPIIKRLKEELQICQNLISSADEYTRKARYGDSPSVGVEDCIIADRYLGTFVRRATAVARTIKLRRLGWSLYRKTIDPAKVEADMKKAMLNLRSEELVPEDALPFATEAVLSEWDNKLRGKWMADFHARHQKAVETMLPLIQGSGDGLKIYADLRHLGGLSLDRLHKPAEFRRESVKKLQASLRAKKFAAGEVQKLRDYLEKLAQAAKAEAQRNLLKSRVDALKSKHARSRGQQKAELGTKIEQIQKAMTMRDTLYEGLALQAYSRDQLIQLGKDLKAGRVTGQSARQAIAKIRSEQDAMNKRARDMIRDQEDTIARLIEEAEKIE